MENICSCGDAEKLIKCSFCFKSQDEVERPIAGTRTLKEKIEKHFTETLNNIINLNDIFDSLDNIINGKLKLDDFKCNLFYGISDKYVDTVFKSLSMLFKEDEYVLDWIYYLVYENSDRCPGKAIVDNKEYPITTVEELWCFLSKEYKLNGEE